MEGCAVGELQRVASRRTLLSREGPPNLVWRGATGVERSAAGAQELSSSWRRASPVASKRRGRGSSDGDGRGGSKQLQPSGTSVCNKVRRYHQDLLSQPSASLCYPGLYIFPSLACNSSSASL